MVRTIIVDDDPMVAQINRQYLEQQEEFVVDGVFFNGYDALEYMRGNAVDLVILDVYMRSMSGMELLRAMRSENISSAVIMITAATEIDVVDEALKLGITDYLVKPYLLSRFLEALQKYLLKSQIIRSAQTVDQSVVDQLLSNPSYRAETANLYKGLNQKTLELIREQLICLQKGEHTCESISASTGLSRVTVRRYLNYMIETSELESSIDYDTGGRPRVLYKVR